MAESWSFQEHERQIKQMLLTLVEDGEKRVYFYAQVNRTCMCEGGLQDTTITK
jgi:hypothetical protein